jgi:hypothetical protein
MKNLIRIICLGFLLNLALWYCVACWAFPPITSRLDDPSVLLPEAKTAAHLKLIEQDLELLEMRVLILELMQDKPNLDGRAIDGEAVPLKWTEEYTDEI